MGVCDRGEGSEGGGDSKSMAIKGAARDGKSASKDRSRVGGLKARTRPAPCEGGSGSDEEPGPALLTWQWRGAEVLTNEARVQIPWLLTTSRRKVNVTRLSRARG